MVATTNLGKEFAGIIEQENHEEFFYNTDGSGDFYHKKRYLLEIEKFASGTKLNKVIITILASANATGSLLLALLRPYRKT